ncbi:complement C1q tumor necrosis factor-related protein 3-like [Mercenaria mercenaria]|uniref:complement C1q tumor necrosis factor-related protein 3-like n=1 Tax=Mercenaria mercenaria TaxID=6596 RepID=UPI00234E381C|nr:complement C1q tumor necrosis factor-related protein 3-like [Mercenaria mercenaria]
MQEIIIKMKPCYTLVFLVLFFVFGCTKGKPVDSEALTKEVEELQNAVALLQRKFDHYVSMNMPVAFTAGLTKTITNLGTKQAIVFDNIFTNEGNGYNSLSGHFTAPVRGVYAFFVVITNIPGHSCSVQLLRNGHFLGHVLAHTKAKTNGNFLTSTLAVTARLKKGDQVWVRNEYAFSPVEQMDGNNWSVFSGHLIGAY